MQGLAGKTVIVTGGGGGIGNATCERLAQEGAQVAVLDRDLAAAQATAQRITAAGGKALAVAADITRRARWMPPSRPCTRARAGRRAGQQRRLGCLQALAQDRPGRVGAADRHQPGGRTAHAPRVLPAWWRAPGRIVNVASDAARVGSSGEAVYAACKGGLVAFPRPWRASMRATASP
jgi:2-hydroxycyclohexanecarboxyl-CoA dehydrogenase